MLDILATYRVAFVSGLLVTMKLAAVVWVSGIFFGGSLGLAGSRYSRSIGFLTRTIGFVISGIPILVLLFWLHYPAQQLAHVVVAPFWTAALALSVVNIFGVEQIVRGAVRNQPLEFTDVARVCGLGHLRTVLHVQLPLVVRQVLPPLLLSQVIMLHMTLFASLISVDDLFRVAQRVNSQIYRPVEIYSALGLFFLLISLPLNALALVLERRFGRDLSER